jgi:SAM-dependent methyltransferase
MYDYYLGGSHNFSGDREVAQKALAVLPEGPLIAQANRAFLRRAVRMCAAEGIRQFIDIGSGIPTLGNVHEVAQQAAADARVVYVDIDPVAVAHSLAILADNPRATAVQEDLRNPRLILDHPEVRRLIDLEQPVALLLVAVLHFLSDAEGVTEILRELGRRLAPGSYLVISHGTDEGWPAETRRIMELYQRAATPLTMRHRAEVERLFDGFTLIEPGVVAAQDWHPDSPGRPSQHPIRASVYAGVGRKR